MTDRRRRWLTFAYYGLFVVLFGIGMLVNILTGMPGRLVGVLEVLVIAALVFLYAGYRKYIRPLFARNKNTGDIPPENPIS
jgi:uncharacterized membrane protein